MHKKPQFYHKSWGTSSTIPEHACALKNRLLNYSRREWIVVYEQLYVLVSTACEKLIWNHSRTEWIVVCEGYPLKNTYEITLERSDLLCMNNCMSQTDVNDADIDTQGE